ncbi:hypothetical protein CAXC1_180018 [Candidatus Xenohaliotis californiensis]|uniref:Uncharacterized protein n=1 Tax=Candidatus Xenohaliotis californiensis TaxID=84677 RepID=A0ABP0ES22_9RICK|nr:hypothetical protein CAXC1_180018 [Candidatus Xenohaliotis californiensis]
MIENDKNSTKEIIGQKSNQNNMDNNKNESNKADLKNETFSVKKDSEIETDNFNLNYSIPEQRSALSKFLSGLKNAINILFSSLFMKKTKKYDVAHQEHFANIDTAKQIKEHMGGENENFSTKTRDSIKYKTTHAAKQKSKQNKQLDASTPHME